MIGVRLENGGEHGLARHERAEDFARVPDVIRLDPIEHPREPPEIVTAESGRHLRAFECPPCARIQGTRRVAEIGQRARQRNIQVSPEIRPRSKVPAGGGLPRGEGIKLQRLDRLPVRLANAAADARIVAAIKAKYAADSDLSVWRISVSSDQGHVTLSGTVSAEENIGKAVALALEADGVRDVTSTLAVKPNQ